MTTEKVLDKLSKLKAAQQGEAALGNSAAAEAFAEAINRLLLQHELSESDIPLTPEQDPIIELFFDPRKFGLKFSKVRVGWQERLASIVARAHLCELLVHSRTNFVTFVGTKAHASFAEQAFATLAGAADRMSVQARTQYWNEHRDEPDFESGNYRAAWLQGFIWRIAERFEEARRKEVSATTSSSTALVRLNQALARAKAHVSGKYQEKAAPTTMGRGIHQAVEDGRRAADNVGLGNRGIQSSAQKKLR